jgi:hypothetical protein
LISIDHQHRARRPGILAHDRALLGSRDALKVLWVIDYGADEREAAFVRLEAVADFYFEVVESLGDGFPVTTILLRKKKERKFSMGY